MKKNTKKLENELRRRAMLIIDELELEEIGKTKEQIRKAEILRTRLLRESRNALTPAKYKQLEERVEGLEDGKLQAVSTFINLFGYGSLEKYTGIDEVMRLISVSERALIDKNVVAKTRNGNLKKKLDREAFNILCKLPFRPNDNLRFDFFNINGKGYVLPYYTLGSVRGKVIYSKNNGIGALIRKNGRVKAIPKLNSPNGGRTCYVPSLGVEIKGIGTIDGMPEGEFPRGIVGEIPDPIGGMIEGKAQYEFISMLYLYIAGIDVPEPIGVVTLQKKLNGKELKGPRGDRLAVFLKKPKTFLRGGDGEKSKKELSKMNYLGLLHCWYTTDNYNAAGQLLDTEGVSLAEEYRISTGRPGESRSEDWKKIELKKQHKTRATGLWNDFLSIRNDLKKRTVIGRIARDEISAIVKTATKLYDEIEKEGTRLVPHIITRRFAPGFADNISDYEARNMLRDPREDLGRLAHHISRYAPRNTREIAEKLYSRYQEDVKATYKVARRFRNVDLLAKV
ncbi:hypothetical protein HZA33_04860 [Candidatus Pacearchaeota archaeon]|nr:hypothetical protein [Candidatus Pacearchaeota archaeon]